MVDAQELFEKLRASRFRSRFKLGQKELNYLKLNGLDVICQQAKLIATQRLLKADSGKDGRQTPMANHPVFIAQHATGTCCRKCLGKWHKIPEVNDLNEQQINYIVYIIRLWLMENGKDSLKNKPIQGQLF